MKAGFLDTSEILKFAKDHTTVPCGRNNEEFRQYSKLCDTITAYIPETSGWYFWISSKDDRSTKPLYIGKADQTSKKNSLRYRINYELKTERICFWAEVVGVEKAFDDHHEFFRGRYDKKSKRALSKAGTKFIIWISDPDVTPSEVREVECILINRHQPTANVQRARQSRASEKSESASAIFQKYRE